MLEQALGALAATGGTALVEAMTTDLWLTLRTRVGRLFRRSGAEQQAALVDELDRDAAVLAETDETGREPVRTRVEIAWQTRLADLLRRHPEAGGELRELVELARAQLPPAARARIVRSEQAVISDGGNNRLGVGQASAEISDSPGAQIIGGGNIG